MRKQLWSLHYGSKALVFTLDATIAIIITIILLLAASGYITKSNDDILPKLQLVKTGSDIITTLDYKKSLDTLNSATITNDLNNILPANYDMKLEIEWADIEDLTNVNSMTINAVPSGKEFVGTGKRFFLVTDNNEKKVNHAGVVEYWIWLK